MKFYFNEKFVKKISEQVKKKKKEEKKRNAFKKKIFLVIF